MTFLVQVDVPKSAGTEETWIMAQQLHTRAEIVRNLRDAP
jgi:hypothetical protein